MKNTWIDLTDIELWAGHHGGTQRVVYGIAKNYYLDKDANTRFFAYSPAKDAFYETSFTPIYERVEKLRNQSILDNYINRSLKQKIKRRLLHHAPAYVRNNKALKTNIKKIAKKTITVAHSVDNLRLRWAATMTDRRSPDINNTVTFTEDDTILILGKPWDNPGLLKLLSREKSTIGFTVVQVVYDLIISLYPHLHHPTLFQVYTQHMFEAVTVSDLMLPISQSSDSDLKKFCEALNLKEPKTSVIRLGDEIEPNVSGESETVKPDERISEKYLLCVGTIENRKNHTLLYQAYKLAEQQGVKLPQLVIVGASGWLSDDIRYLITHDPQTRDKILILNNISDSSLAWLYKNTLFTVYPSLYEGWGLPVAESMAYGKLCVSSNISSMPEISGDLADYFSPYSASECLDTIKRYTTDKDALAKKEEYIRKNYQSTTWHDTYTQVKSYLKHLR